MTCYVVSNLCCCNNDDAKIHMLVMIHTGYNCCHVVARWLDKGRSSDPYKISSNSHRHSSFKINILYYNNIQNRMFIWNWYVFVW